MIRQTSFLAPLFKAGYINELSHSVGDWMNSRAHQQDLRLGVLAALVSNQLSRQQVCVTHHELERLWRQTQTLLPEQSGCPSPEHWLQTEPYLVGTPESGETECPLIYDDGQWYLQRYWQHEVRLASRLTSLARQRYDLDLERVSTLVEQLFGSSKSTTADWQKIAVVVAAMHQLAIITGGPGTGKTTTVSRLLALIQTHALEQGEPLRIIMAAPTGKAAARLSESLMEARQRLPSEIAPHLPDQAVTVHRLLGPIPHRVGFRHHSDNPIVADVLVLDEASMVDLPLMRRCLEALPSHCRVIMLGDHHQLASVEVGSVLDDIGASWYRTAKDDDAQFDSELCGVIEQVTGAVLPSSNRRCSALQNNLVRLRHSHRFDANSGVGRLAEAINAGDDVAALAVMSGDDMDVTHHARPSHRDLVAIVDRHFPAYLTACQNRDLNEAFQALAQIQILCATRQGQWGRDHLNLLIEQHLAKGGWIRPQQDFYAGRPIMVTQNNYRLQRFNGDIGIVLPDEDGLLKVWFQRSDGGYDSLLPSRVPAHDTLYAMTIHKSQGSEFTHAVVCLPDTLSHVLSRELLYTGVTRAKQQVSVFARHDVLNAAIAQPCQRGSGLAARLQRTTQQ